MVAMAQGVRKELGLEIYKSWLLHRAPQLWGLLVFSQKATEQELPDFFETLDKIFHRVSGRYSENFDTNLWTRAIVNDWRKRYRLDNESLYLLGALRFSWTFDELSTFTFKSAAHIKMRLFESLMAREPVVALPKHQNRDCARYDLRAVEDLLGLPWKDPLELFNRAALSAHLESCSRCRDVKRQLEEAVHEIQHCPLATLPEDFVEQIRFEKDRHRWSHVKAWYHRWPWFLRIPTQLVFICSLIYAVLAVPYAGDFLPSRARLTQWAERLGYGTSKKEVVVAANNASPAVVETPLPAAKIELAPAKVEMPPVGAAPVATPVVTAAAPAASTAPVPAPVATPVPTRAEPALEVANPKGEKVVYHWYASAGNLEDQTKNVLSLLRRYSAERAGNLALGAPNSGGRYFHFSISQDDFDDLYRELAPLGLEKISSYKAASSKLTPAGRSRIVLILLPLRGGPKSKAATSSAPEGAAPPSAPATPSTDTNS